MSQVVAEPPFGAQQRVGTPYKCVLGGHKQQNRLQLMSTSCQRQSVNAWSSQKMGKDQRTKPPLPHQNVTSRYMKMMSSSKTDQSPRIACSELGAKPASRPSSVRSSTPGQQVLRPSRNSVTSLFPANTTTHRSRPNARIQEGIGALHLRLAGELVDDDEELMDQILTEAESVAADLQRFHSENDASPAGASGAGDLWILVGSEGHDYIQAYDSGTPDAHIQMPDLQVEDISSPEQANAETTSPTSDAETSSPINLANELKVHHLENCWEEVAKLGIHGVKDLAFLRPEDIDPLCLNPLQKRLLLTAMEREAAATKTALNEVQNATREWEKMCDGSSSGWYSPAFTEEPAGMRITILEPSDLAGTVFDLGFGESRDDLSPLVSKRESKTQLNRSEYEINIAIRRGETTKLDAASAVLTLAVGGISKQHAKLQISCGDGVPHEACIIDEGSTNGTFLMRHLPKSFLPSKHKCDSPDMAGIAQGDQKSRPQTPAQLIQLQAKPNSRLDLQGIPYLRLGPKVVLGLTLLKGSSDFGLQDVQNKTEQLHNEGQLRHLGWEEVDLEQVCMDRRKKAHTLKLLQAFTHGAKSFVLNSKQQLTVSERAKKATTSPLRGPTLHSDSHTSHSEADDHIFLSYQWDSQKIVKMIADALKLQGYHVWIDLDRMTGDINQRMAEAVEGSAVVCPCITRKYKTSANCMKELNYSDQRNCTMVPLILEACDRTELLSGQVGLITSNLLYVDFSKALKGLQSDDSDEKKKAMAIFDKKVGELRRALGDRGKKSQPAELQANPQSSSSPPIDNKRAFTVRPPLA